MRSAHMSKAAILATAAMFACSRPASEDSDKRVAETQRPAEAGGTAPQVGSEVPDGMSKAAFNVNGMYCGGCVAATRATLRRLPGVQDAGADLVSAEQETGTAWVIYDPKQVAPEQIIAAIEKLGYKATLAQP